MNVPFNNHMNGSIYQMVNMYLITLTYSLVHFGTSIIIIHFSKIGVCNIRFRMIIFKSFFLFLFIRRTFNADLKMKSIFGSHT